MNSIAIVFLLVNTVALLWLKRSWAPLPLLMGTMYMTLGSGINVGPFSFTVIRLLIGVGVARVIMRGERPAGKINTLDWMMLVWGTWALSCSIFHKTPTEALIFRLGIVYNILGVYFLLRIFCQSMDDVVRLCRVTAILLVPVAIEMFYEQLRGHNFFAVLGRVSEFPELRKGRLRAQGPFGHSILAGTVGAVCLPLMIGIWQRHRKEAIAGIAACVTIIYSSASSGPIMTCSAAIGALFMWHYRSKMRIFRWLAVLCYIGLELIMTRPAYFIMARIDLTGGSTGWHRSELIRTAISHLSEWWFAGTDYTRHWMPTGVTWSPDHTDITNYYLKMGVWGGLPLMMLFIAALTKGFSFVGDAAKETSGLPSEDRFFIWALGASLFSHAVTSFGVSYFDQSFLFLYLTLAAIGSARSVEVILPPPANVPAWQIDGSLRKE